MSIIDFHSHILPGIDDGSKNVETSLAMLEEAKAQKVNVMVATPHFYAENESIETFIQKREWAYENMMQVLPEDAPQILLGAEVAFFKGISDAEKIDSLFIQNADILLLEMPFTSWSLADIEEVRKMVQERKIRIMLAHIERFMKISSNKHYIKELLKLPVIIQINAGSLLDWRQCRKIVKLFHNGKNYVLGSDCHDMCYRPPNLSDGRSVLNKRMGKEAIHQMDQLGRNLLSFNEI